MMQETSLEAWTSLQPKLQTRREQVMVAISFLGSATNMEIAEHLGWSINRVTPRVNELLADGRLYIVLTRPCRVTGHSARVVARKENSMQGISRTGNHIMKW